MLSVWLSPEWLGTGDSRSAIAARVPTRVHPAPLRRGFCFGLTAPPSRAALAAGRVAEAGRPVRLAAPEQPRQQCYEPVTQRTSTGRICPAPAPSNVASTNSAATARLDTIRQGWRRERWQSPPPRSEYGPRCHRPRIAIVPLTPAVGAGSARAPRDQTEPAWISPISSEQPMISIAIEISASLTNA